MLWRIQGIFCQREDGTETGIQARAEDTGQSHKLIPKAQIIVSGPRLLLFLSTFRNSLFPSELRSLKFSSPTTFFSASVNLGFLDTVFLLSCPGDECLLKGSVISDMGLNEPHLGVFISVCRGLSA